MPSDSKIKAVEELTEKLSRSKVTVATNFSQMSVNAMNSLRQTLRAQGIEYRVVKNTLTERAADAAGKPEIKELLEGSTGLAFGYDDPVQPIKVISEFVRTNRSPLVVRAAAMDGRVYRQAQLAMLLTLPSRDVLIAQFMGQLNSPLVRLATVLNQPLQGLATVLNGPLRGLATVLQQRVAQQGGA